MEFKTRRPEAKIKQLRRVQKATTQEASRRIKEAS